MTENKKFNDDGSAIDPKTLVGIMENQKALLVIATDNDPITYNLYPIKIKAVETIEDKLYADDAIYETIPSLPNRLKFKYDGSALDPLWRNFYSKMRKLDIKLRLNDLKRGFLKIFK